MPSTVSNGLVANPGSAFEQSKSEGDVSAALQRIQMVENLVARLMASWLESGELASGRRAHRVQHDAPFVVTPLDDTGTHQVGDSRLARAWDISTTGISFMHDDPLSCRNVATSFLRPDGVLESLAARLKWCRFTRDQRYRSGGKFLTILGDTVLADSEVGALLHG